MRRKSEKSSHHHEKAKIHLNKQERHMSRENDDSTVPKNSVLNNKETAKKQNKREDKKEDKSLVKSMAQESKSVKKGYMKQR